MVRPHQPHDRRLAELPAVRPWQALHDPNVWWQAPVTRPTARGGPQDLAKHGTRADAARVGVLVRLADALECNATDLVSVLGRRRPVKRKPQKVSQSP
jgi:hypothetical protein